MRSSGTWSLVIGAALLLAPVAGFADAAADSPGESLHCNELPFVYNVFWTTKHGPAGAGVEMSDSNMLRCSGPAYALCHYSGPAPMPCKVDRERGVAVCVCYALEPRAEPYSYVVDIHAILNTCAYIETVRDCGHDGSGCSAVNSAPVCRYLAREAQALMPGADLVSTFGLSELERYGKIGCTECDGLYAGCMTAPCRVTRTAEGRRVAVCECPLYQGRHQVGQEDVACDLAPGLVWSAAYDPSGCSDDGAR